MYQVPPTSPPPKTRALSAEWGMSLALLVSGGLGVFVFAPPVGNITLSGWPRTGTIMLTLLLLGLTVVRVSGTAGSPRFRATTCWRGLSTALFWLVLGLLALWLALLLLFVAVG